VRQLRKRMATAAVLASFVLWVVLLLGYCRSWILNDGISYRVARSNGTAFSIGIASGSGGRLSLGVSNESPMSGKTSAPTPPPEEGWAWHTSRVEMASPIFWLPRWEHSWYSLQHVVVRRSSLELPYLLLLVIASVAPVWWRVRKWRDRPAGRNGVRQKRGRNHPKSEDRDGAGQEPIR
jgi:hypothetical protein